jgi:hypothetical protein
VDLQCDRFEACWKSGCPPRLEDYLAAWQDPVHDAVRRRLLRELVVIDMEYRWRKALAATTADPERANANARSPSERFYVLPYGPVLEDYLSRFPELLCGEQDQLDLVVAEYRVRQEWGDRPPYGAYRQRFPQVGSSLEPTLRGVALQLTSAVLRVYEREILVFATNFTSPVELGRQKTGETPPVSRVAAEHIERIVLAPVHDPTISRSQLYLDVVAKNVFLVENRSRKSSVFVEGKDRLPAGETRCLSLPFGVSVGRITVQMGES